MTATRTSTSRVGRKPIHVPQGVEIKKTGSTITVKGSHGQHHIALHPYVNISIEADVLHVQPNEEVLKTISAKSKKLYRSIVGTLRANIANTIEGVHKGYVEKLVLIGVGYRAQSKGKTVTLSLGYSNPIEYLVPEHITIETPTQTEILIKGFDKEKVGQVAAEIRSKRPPEPYKGKGVRYANEKVEIKETKKK